MAKKAPQKNAARKAPPTPSSGKKKTVPPKKVVRKAPVKKIASKTAPQKKTTPTAAVKAPGKKTTPKATSKVALDFSAFPTESIVSRTLGLCLACALDVLTRHLGLSPDRATAEIRKYTPQLEELSAASPSRPYMEWPANLCPSCGAPPKWHAPLTIVKIEGSKATDLARRALMKKIGESASFAVIEEKSTEREALYSWLSKIGAELNLDSSGWLLEAARHWLGRKLPKEDWGDIFQQIRFVRRSKELDEDEFEIKSPGLYLAPLLFDEILLIQYLLSRSHKAGGLTFEGRLTLQDLFQRLRGGGYLRRVGVVATNAAEALEKLLEMQGGEGRVKFHYIVDRRELLSRLAALKGSRVPRPRI